MLRATLRGFLAHRGRMALSLLAVVLSVAFVAGTLLFTDTIGSTFDRLFRSTASDVTVTPHSDFSREQQQYSGAVPVLPESVAARVAAVPGVAAARPRVQVSGVTLVSAAGKDIGSTGGAPNLAADWYQGPESPVRLASGRLPRADGEAVVDADTMKRAGLAIGERLRVIAGPGSFQVRITGSAAFTTTNPGASLLFLDFAAAQRRLLGRPDQITGVDVTAARGVTDAVLARRIRTALGDSPAYDVRTREQQAKNAAQQLGTFLTVLKDALLGFAGIAVLVGISLILNTFSMLVAQRTQELGLLRALGATRRQVNRSVLVEALLLGLLGSTLGLAVGIGLAVGLMRLTGAFGMVLQAGQITFRWTTPLAAYLVGVLVTAVSAYLPARRAARVSPMAALREADAPATGGSLRRRAALGGSLVVLGAAGLAGAAVSSQAGPAAEFLGAGVLLSLVGLIAVGPLLARPVIRVLGAAFPRMFGAVGRMSQRNALRNPRRTGATASALMIGLALVAGLAVTGSSMAASFDEQVDRVFGADFGVQNANGRAFTSEITDAVRSTPGIGLVVRERDAPAELTAPDGVTTKVLLLAIDPGFDQVVHQNYRAGDTASGTAPGHLIVGGGYADAHHLALGSPVTVRFANGASARLLVGAITPADNGLVGLGGDPTISTATLQHYAPGMLDSAVYANAARGADKARVKAALSRALAPYPQVKVRDQSDYKQLIRRQINVLLRLIYGLLGLAIVIAVLGVVNTLALSVVERTREIGLLRAIGLARRQLRRMIRLESVVIAVFGAVLGLGLGLVWGVTAQRLLTLKGMTVLSVPWATMLAVMVGAAVVGLVAALGPALRASRLNVLDAIAHE